MYDNMRTSWVRVMTPDGGGSKDVKSNRRIEVTMQSEKEK